ncbi:hypothetical protein FH972_024287 [Carpinus fangiana]|uniref:GED domain-containing protein n=1 Tax=Carpinus fangiana TaxID=176857 RepID=A0A5N6KYI1_9ROSI|nr:hypothetical protein FH972_024287 [Carpinus fangiana]
MSLPNELQSGETDMILNTIDELRSLGIGNILELPQIIVCGDQSSGKSSVLNAVSTLKFPTKDGLCTRFATEVIMRPGNPEHIAVSIVPGSGRLHDDRRNLEAFRRIIINMDKIEDVINEATETMGINPENPRARRFSNDILRFEVTGPNQPSLTLVDLPGLFQAPNRYQTEEDTESVKELVLRYMRNKRSVILAVISAKSDFVLQSVTKYSRDVDRRGVRTLGIITKPDKLDVGSDSEKEFVELAENRLAFFHRGWHVLVNRDHNTANYTQVQRDDAEKEFLSNGVWARLPPNHKGIFKLRTRLSGLLRDQILEELPDLIREAQDEITRCETGLFKLGVSRATPEDRRRYLIQAAQTYNVTMRSCINGLYEDEFFNGNDKTTDNKKRLRAVVQNTLLQYAVDMHRLGHARHIVDELSANGEGQHPWEVTKEEFEDVVMDLTKQSRGRELMGTYSPLIVRELFVTQSEPWVELTQNHQFKIQEAVKMSINLVLQHATDENTKTQLERLIIKPSLDHFLVLLDEMVSKLLTPRRERHPITYNRNLAESIQKAKQAFAEKVFSEKYDRAINTNGQVVSKETLKWLFEEQIVVPPADLERFAASEAIDVMRAYYKIAKETLIDNFSTLAIEDCLLSQIPDLLTPQVITKLDDEEIGTIAMETETTAWDRSEIEKRLELCASALTKLEKIQGVRLISSTYDTTETEIVGHKRDLMDDTGSSGWQNTVEVSKLDLGISDEENELLSASEDVIRVEKNELSQTSRQKRKLKERWVS